MNSCYEMSCWSYNGRAVLENVAPCAVCGINLQGHHHTMDSESLCWNCAGFIDEHFPGAVGYVGASN